MASSSSSNNKSNNNNKPNKNNNKNTHQRIEHITEIDAPIETVWKALIDVNDGWPKWNKWTLLEAGTPTTGLKGTLKACYEGNDEDWQTFQFEFAEVNHDNHIMAWKGSVGPFDGCLFRGYHVMRLQEELMMVNNNNNDDDDGKKRRTTRLIHTETFGGLLPFLHMGLPYDKLDRNYRLMNESLKAFVEEGQQKK